MAVPLVSTQEDKGRGEMKMRSDSEVATPAATRGQREGISGDERCYAAKGRGMLTTWGVELEDKVVCPTSRWGANLDGR
jgi:hypothetical protein